MLEDYKLNAYEYANTKCSEEQMTWQLKVLDLLASMSESIVKRTSIFNIANHDGNIDRTISVILMSEWLKQLDGTMLLVKYGKFGAAQILVRTMLELSVQLSYMLFEDKETKAAYYAISHSIKNQKLKNEFTKEQNTSELSNDKDIIINDLKTTNSEILVNKAKKVLSFIDNINTEIRSWYVLYRIVEKVDKDKKIKSISSLIDYIAELRDPGKGFLNSKTIYDYLSRYAHGFFALNNSYILNNQQYFRPYESLENADGFIIMIVKLAELNYISFYKAYGLEYGDPSDLGKEIDLLESRLGELLKNLNTLKLKYH